MSKTKLQQIEDRIKSLEGILKNLRARREELKKHQFVKCVGSIHGKGCGKKSQVKGLIWVQEHYCDNEPYAERYRHGSQWFVCKHCGVLNEAEPVEYLMTSGRYNYDIHKNGTAFKKDFMRLHEAVEKYYGVKLKVISWWRREAGLK